MTTRSKQKVVKEDRNKSEDGEEVEDQAPAQSEEEEDSEEYTNTVSAVVGSTQPEKTQKGPKA